MKKVIYFTQGPVATTTELNDILTIQQEIVTTHSLSVFNENESPDFGAGPAPADYANGTVPSAYAHLPKFTGVGGGGLEMPNFLLPMYTVALTGENEQEFTIPLSSLGIEIGYRSGMRISSDSDFNVSLNVNDETNNFEIVVNTVEGLQKPIYMMVGFDKSDSPSMVLPVNFI